MESHKNELEAQGYAIVGVSRDKEETQAKFAEKYGLSFPLIADTDTTLLQELGAWGEKKMYGKTSVGIIRTTLLVDGDGIVRAIFKGKEINTKTHAEQLLAFINEKLK